MDFKMENSPHVTHVVNLEIGERVTVNGFVPALNDKISTIKDIRLCKGASQTGIEVLLNHYPRYIDSAWIIKLT